MDFYLPGIRDRRLAAADEHRAKRNGEDGLPMHIFGKGTPARRMSRRYFNQGRTGFNIANAEVSRNPSIINTIVLHQTTFISGDSLPPQNFDNDISSNHRLDKVIAHFVVRVDGAIIYSHDLEHIVNNGGGRHGIDIEIEGNYSHTPQPVGARLSRWTIASARTLISALVSHRSMIISNIHPHGQIQKNSRSKFDSCCGPDIWVNVGQWAVSNLDLNCQQPISYYPNKGISEHQSNQAYNQDSSMAFAHDLDQMFGSIDTTDVDE